jgi:hypothetical protein
MSNERDEAHFAEQRVTAPCRVGDHHVIGRAQSAGMRNKPRATADQD